MTKAYDFSIFLSELLAVDLKIELEFFFSQKTTKKKKSMLSSETTLRIAFDGWIRWLDAAGALTNGFIATFVENFKIVMC